MGTEEEEVNISLLSHKLEDCYEPSALVLLGIGTFFFFLESNQGAQHRAFLLSSSVNSSREALFDLRRVCDG